MHAQNYINKNVNVMLGLLMNLEFGALIDPELGLVLNLYVSFKYLRMRTYNRGAAGQDGGLANEMDSYVGAHRCAR